MIESQAPGRKSPDVARIRWLTPRDAKRIGWTIALLGLLLLLVWGARVIWIVRSLQLDLSQAQAVFAGPAPIMPSAACDAGLNLRHDVVSLRRETGLLVDFAPALGWLPRIGGDLRAAPHLLSIADAATEVGAALCDVFGPALSTPSGTSERLSLERMVALLAANRPVFRQAVGAAERAQAAWAQVAVPTLSYSLAQKASLLDRGLPLMHAGLAAANLAPDLMGASQPRTYLVLALNEDELRPGGGFISGVGEVRIEAGRIVTMTFRDSYSVDDYHLPYPEPPDPLRRYLGVDLWVFRDSNWSPDFPTAVRQAIALYRPGHPVDVDGVIAVDQHGVQALVDALGPLAVPGEKDAVTGANIVAYIRHAWAPENGKLTGAWWTQHKSFMGPLAQAAWQRIQSGQVDWTALGLAALRLLQEKHLLVYLADPAAAAVLAEQNWDGALRPGVGDYLSVIDANVGYNKASSRLRETISYDVDLSSEPAQSVLTLTQTHTGAIARACIPEVRYDPVYEQMMDRCSWNYIQVFVPEGDRLLDATRVPLAGESVFSGQPESGAVNVTHAAEGPWQVLGVLSVLAPSTSQTRTYTLTLPASVVARQGSERWYRLRVQKQAGTSAIPVTLHIRLPAQGELIDASMPVTARDAEWLVFSFDLDRDRDIIVHFKSRE